MTDLAGRTAAFLCSAGAVALVASLFGPWYATEFEPAYFDASGPVVEGVEFEDSGWVAFGVIDLVLVAIAALALGAVWSAARDRRDRVQVLLVAATAAVAGLALVVWRLIDPPLEGADPAAAAWVGVAALAAIVAGGALGARRYSGPTT